jgi:hypothetical protein
MNASPLVWLRRSCGKWRSERRYLFSEEKGTKPVNYTTLMEIYEGERGNQFIIEWTGKTSGRMEVELDGNMLVRSRDYIGDGAHDSEVDMVDEDTFVTTTTYNGITFREEIRLLSHDQYRLRQTFGTKADGSFALCGQYIEFRE